MNGCSDGALPTRTDWRDDDDDDDDDEFDNTKSSESGRNHRLFKKLTTGNNQVLLHIGRNESRNAYIFEKCFEVATGIRSNKRPTYLLFEYYD